MWESEKLFVRKAFSEVMAAEKKISRTVRFMQKSCLIEADQNCLFCQRPQKKKKKRKKLKEEKLQRSASKFPIPNILNA